MSEQNIDFVPEKKLSGFEKALSENTIATSIITGSLIVAVSVIIGAFIVKGGWVIGQTQKDTIGTEAPIKVANRSGQPSIGSANAKVTIYEFADFQCPFCQNFFKNSYPAIKEKYIDTGKVRIVFRHFPLSFHTNAQISAEAAECANRQGKFDAYHDMLFSKGSGDGTGLDLASLKGYASALGLNTLSFNQCLDNHDTKTIVAGDLAEGTKAGVSGTPTFFINGKSIVGAQPIAVFEQEIDAALK